MFITNVWLILQMWSQLTYKIMVGNLVVSGGYSAVCLCICHLLVATINCAAVNYCVVHLCVRHVCVFSIHVGDFSSF